MSPGRRSAILYGTGALVAFSIPLASSSTLMPVPVPRFTGTQHPPSVFEMDRKKGVPTCIHTVWEGIVRTTRCCRVRVQQWAQATKSACPAKQGPVGGPCSSAAVGPWCPSAAVTRLRCLWISFAPTSRAVARGGMRALSLVACALALALPALPCRGRGRGGVRVHRLEFVDGGKVAEGEVHHVDVVPHARPVRGRPVPAKHRQLLAPPHANLQSTKAHKAHKARPPPCQPNARAQARAPRGLFFFPPHPS